MHLSSHEFVPLPVDRKLTEFLKAQLVNNLSAHGRIIHLRPQSLLTAPTQSCPPRLVPGTGRGAPRQPRQPLHSWIAEAAHGVGGFAIPAAEEIKVAAFVRLENVVEIHPAVPVRAARSGLTPAGGFVADGQP